MKTFVKVFAWIAFVVALLSFASETRAATLGSMRIVLADGDVQVKIADTGEWAPASINMPLVEGDELWVPEDGRAALQTSNGAYIRLDRSTALQVLRMDRDAFQFYLPQGGVYVLNRASRRSVFQFDTPDASLRAFGGSTFRVDVPEGETDLSVLHGTVIAENEEGTTNVRAGDMLVLASDGYAELFPLPSPDEWQRWNEERDRTVLARGEGSRHLPPELRVYASDFDRNGRWVSVPDYGYVWTPTVLVVSDWAPYRHGRWVWRGGEYVWIGYEPWGWAPYHYGRWAFVARVGWCWVPPARGDVYWGPGYVGWVNTDDYVAWVPLAPRETYYGHGHFGRYSVNVTNVNINRIRVTNVYRNVNVTNSVTVVNHTTFVTGRHEPVRREFAGNAREHFTQRRNIVVGRPPIKPVEATRVPVVRSIPESKRPPESVRRIEAKELRNARPLVRESGRSAIRPEAKPRTLEIRKTDERRPIRERVKERKEVLPAERRAPAERVAPKQPPRQEREIERERIRPEQQRPAEPPERVERGKRKEAPPAPAEEQVRPEEQRPQRGTPPVKDVERPRRPAAPPEPRKEEVRPEQQRKAPQEVERGRRKEAPPAKEEAKPEEQRQKQERGKGKDQKQQEEQGGKKKQENKEDSGKTPGNSDREREERGRR
jgi:hypothetical protein